MFFCKKCLMPNTRPRLTFNETGICSACQWEEEKKTIVDWAQREKELCGIIEHERGKHNYDILVPVSGGKDSSYVASILRDKYKLHVLTVTITPPLESNIIRENLSNFLNLGFENIKITPDPVITREINIKGFVEQGRPLLSWTMCLNTVVAKVAVLFGIPMIMFGEEGESEYGGTNKLRYTASYDMSDTINIYNEGNNPEELSKDFIKGRLNWWAYPTKKELEDNPINVLHWSYFENWDPYRHYLYVKGNCNFIERDSRSIGTYNTFAQMDTVLYDLHTYMMYLKFGFGRCLQDACIDIRKGRISREEGLKLVKQYDGEHIEEYIPTYLNYFGLSREEFDKVLDRHVNKELFIKHVGIWEPIFEVV